MENKEKEFVKHLGEKIGYGNMMTLASQLWKESLKEKGYQESGAFVPNLDDKVRFQPRLIDDELKKILEVKMEHLKINDEFGWTGEWRMSTKDSLDLIMDVLNAL